MTGSAAGTSVAVPGSAAAETMLVGAAASASTSVAALPGLSPAALKTARQRAIRELVARSAIGSQQDLVDALRARGMDVTQATVSRDVAELGLIKITRADRHVYVAAADLATGSPATSDALLRRLLADIPVRVGRSGLILVLTAPPGTASSVAQGIDQSTLTEQEGTLAGDNTVLVLFADDARLEHWLERFTALGPARGPDTAPVAGPTAGLVGATAGGPSPIGTPSSMSRPQEVSR